MLGPLLFLIHISVINTEITDSTVSRFAYDTRTLLGIKDEEDTRMLQKDLRQLYIWAHRNNMKFDASKLKLLRYGKGQEIKTASIDKSYDDSSVDSK